MVVIVSMTTKSKETTKKSFKKTLKKIWWFLWDDDSLASWIVNIIIAFILIKFVVYPGLAMGFGTSHPVVAVVSGSMEHLTTNPCVEYTYFKDVGRKVCTKWDKTKFDICGERFDENQKVKFDFFWETCGDHYRNYNINKLQFEKFPFKNGFNTGDIMALFGSKPDKIDVGDVIVFMGNERDPIIHRVIEIKVIDEKYYFTTRGDHNPMIHDFEVDISEDRLIGKAVFRIPYLGKIKIWFVDLLRVLHLENIIGGWFN
jgi:signal peptidase I